jgi:hypothetical protein
VDRGVAELQSTFGKRAIRRRHQTPAPDGTAADQVRYLSQLVDLNNEFLDRLATIVMPDEAQASLRALVSAVDQETVLMRNHISAPEVGFRSLEGKVDELENVLIGAFLDVLGTLDPGAIARGEMH